MTFDEIMHALEMLGSEQIKNIYLNHGAHEPLFGVTTAAMKPLVKKVKKNQDLAELLYETGNYDAMYFAGLIADPQTMTEADFERWMGAAYFQGLSDYVVAANLVQSQHAIILADRWIASGKEFHMSAGWTCYALLVGARQDNDFEHSKLQGMLHTVITTIHEQPNRTRYAMNNFVISLGISYLPLHEEAVKAAATIGKVHVYMGKTACKVPAASAYIEKAAAQGKLGIKRSRG